MEELSDRYLEASGLPPHRIRGMGLEPRAVEAVTRARRHLRRTLRCRGEGPHLEEDRETALGIALLTGYPDRVARRREAGKPQLVLAGGEQARLSPMSVVHDAPFLVALDAEECSPATRRGPALVRLATRIDPDWLLELYTDSVVEEDDHVWNPQSERVDLIRRLSYGSVVLDELRRAAAPSPSAAQVLARAARAVAWEHAALDRLMVRLTLLGTCVPELALPQLTDAFHSNLLESACSDSTSFAELRSVPLPERVLMGLDPRQAQALRDLAPDAVKLPGGRWLRVEYEQNKPPWAASRLQDFFGLTEGPRVANGKLPLTLHLLAPNRRAVQVTNDLSGFWVRHYPALRKELMRRYPKHDWPENGAAAKPPPPGRLRAAR